MGSKAATGVKISLGRLRVEHVEQWAVSAWALAFVEAPWRVGGPRERREDSTLSLSAAPPRWLVGVDCSWRWLSAIRRALNATALAREKVPNLESRSDSPRPAFRFAEPLKLQG